MLSCERKVMEKNEVEMIAQRVRHALAADLVPSLLPQLSELHSADRGAVFEELSAEERRALLQFFGTAEQANILQELDEQGAAELAMTMPSGDLADVLDEMSPDVAADILGDMPQEAATSTLSQMEEADEVRPLLSYPDDTAGGLMSTDFLAFSLKTSAQAVIDKLRTDATDADAPYYLYITDDSARLSGIVGLRSLIVASPSATMAELMQVKVISVPVDADQELVANLMKKYRLALLPVLDNDGRMLGVIHSDDIVYVLEEEATEDMLRLANVSDTDLEVWSPIGKSVSRRLPWLYINLMTAFLAASVVNFFESTISKVAILAVFQGIVAGQGGNAGTQTLALIVRGIALGEVEFRDVGRVLGREVIIGALHGIAVGVAVALCAWAWKGIPFLGVIVGLAMLGNMVAAGVAGTVIPLSLRALKLDPALASAVLVTTVTDCVGFGLFLGLATMFMSHLQI